MAIARSQDLFDDGVLIDLNVRHWSGQKKLKAEDLDISVDKVPDIFSLGRKYLVPKESINLFATMDTRARRLVESLSFAFPVGSTRFVPKNVLMELLDKLEDNKADYYHEVEAFINSYAVQRTEMQAKYYKYWASLEPLYPRTQDLWNKFSFGYSIFEMKAPRSFNTTSRRKLKAQDEAMERYRSQLNNQMDNFAQDVVMQLRSDAAELCNNIVEKIKNGDAVTERSMNVLRKAVEKFEKLNFVGDVRVETMLQDLRSQWLTQDITEFNRDGFKAALEAVVRSADNVNDISSVTGTYKRKLNIA
jgi:hypothetical protein